MFLGKVIGTVWSTKKTPDLEGVRFLIVHPYDLDREPTKNVVVVADRLGAGAGALGKTGAEVIATGCAAATGRLLATGRVSKATRLMSIRCSGETLSEVTLPPQDPQPSVIDGGSAVEKPIAPCVVGVFTVTREAGISPPYRIAASRERV